VNLSERVIIHPELPFSTGIARVPSKHWGLNYLGFERPDSKMQNADQSDISNLINAVDAINTTLVEENHHSKL
jgi:hypothetical protein